MSVCRYISPMVNLKRFCYNFNWYPIKNDIPMGNTPRMSYCHKIKNALLYIFWKGVKCSFGRRYEYKKRHTQRRTIIPLEQRKLGVNRYVIIHAEFSFFFANIKLKWRLFIADIAFKMMSFFKQSIWSAKKFIFTFCIWLASDYYVWTVSAYCRSAFKLENFPSTSLVN